MSIAVKLNKEEIFLKIKKMINAHNGTAESDILLSSNLADDLGLDSLDITWLVVNAEKEFQVFIANEIMIRFTIMQDLVDYIDQALQYKILKR